jgi:hypothetical protein
MQFLVHQCQDESLVYMLVVYSQHSKIKSALSTMKIDMQLKPFFDHIPPHFYVKVDFQSPANSDEHHYP